MVDLNLKDAPIRLRIPLEELSDTPVNPADPSIEKIRKALTKQSEAGAMEALVLPAALGNHVDHLTVREAAISFTTTLPSAFYEDLPYATTHPSAATDLEALREADGTTQRASQPRHLSDRISRRTQAPSSPWLRLPDRRRKPAPSSATSPHATTAANASGPTRHGSMPSLPDNNDCHSFPCNLHQDSDDQTCF